MNFVCGKKIFQIENNNAFIFAIVKNIIKLIINIHPDKTTN